MEQSGIQKPDKLNTLVETVERLRICAVTLWKERRDGKITATKIRSKIFFSDSEIERYLKANTKEVVNG